MSEAILNQLFEDAITRCTEFSEQSLELRAAVDELGGRAQELEGNVSSRTEDVLKHLQSLAERLEAAQDALSTAGDQAKAGLDALASRAGEVKSDAESLLSRIHAGIEELGARRQELADALESEVEGAGEEVEKFAEQADAVESALDAALDQAQATIERFGDAIEAAREEWVARRESVETALADLEERAAAQVREYVETVDEVLQSQGTVLSTLVNEGLVAPHQSAMEALEGLVKGAADGIKSDAEPLVQALRALGEVCRDQQEALGQQADEILKQVEQTVGVLERVTPVVQSTDRLE
jgi:ABC-type transporter Mla subunit MlaD